MPKSFTPLKGGLAALADSLVQSAGAIGRNAQSASTEMIVIDAVAKDGDGAALLIELEALGLQRGGAFGAVASGLMPVASLAEAGQLANLLQAMPGLATANVGATTAQSDYAMYADDARANFGVDGTGVSIGVLSDSYDVLGDADDDIASGDLPAAGVTVLEEGPNDGIDEGRAMLQLIHDSAPGADLLFHSAFLGQANFAQGIVDLADAGADIIVDDIIYYAEPMFQDGIIAQAVDEVEARGVAFFSSAGNQADNAWASGFVDSGHSGTGALSGDLHDFDPGPATVSRLRVSIEGLTTATFVFQWDQPYASAGGPGSASDYDIAAYTTGLFPSAVASGTDNNIGSDPIEIFDVTNASPTRQNFDIRIARFSGPDADMMKLTWFGSDVQINSFPTNSGTIYGHANAAGAMAVGAAAYWETPEYGVDPALPEAFSSHGDAPIYFDAAGNRLAAPEQRGGPHFVAPDGGNTTFFGSDADSDGFPNFFGTSASAPSAAAVGALMLELDPGLTPAEMEAILIATSLDMGVTGTDDVTGAGLIDANAALAALQAQVNVPVSNDTQGTTHNSLQEAFDAAQVGDAVTVNPALYVAEPVIVNRTDDIHLTMDGPIGAVIVVATGATDFTHTGTADMYVRLANGDKTGSTGSGNDVLVGTGGNNVIDTGDGDDIGKGGNDNDVITGGAGVDSLHGNNGDDILYGGRGIDRLLGHQDNDQLFSGNGPDTLLGGDGDDYLNGGIGDDRMWGGVGQDVFSFTYFAGTDTGDGRDRIFDFEDGIDLIEMAGGLAFGDLEIFNASFGGLTGTAVEYTVATDAVSAASSSGVFLIGGLNAADLTAADFVFV